MRHPSRWRNLWIQLWACGQPFQEAAARLVDVEEVDEPEDVFAAPLDEPDEVDEPDSDPVEPDDEEEDDDESEDPVAADRSFGRLPFLPVSLARLSVR